MNAQLGIDGELPVTRGEREYLMELLNVLTLIAAFKNGMES